MDTVVNKLLQLYDQGEIDGHALNNSLKALQTPADPTPTRKNVTPPIPKPSKGRLIPKPHKHKPISKPPKRMPIPKPRKCRPTEPTDDEMDASINELLVEFKPRNPAKAPPPPPTELKWDETKALGHHLRAWKMQVTNRHPPNVIWWLSLKAPSPT